MGYELERDGWREESRERVEEALRNASRFHGTMQTKENLAALEAMKAEMQNLSRDRLKDYINGSSK